MKDAARERAAEQARAQPSFAALRHGGFRAYFITSVLGALVPLVATIALLSFSMRAR